MRISDYRNDLLRILKEIRQDMPTAADAEKVINVLRRDLSEYAEEIARDREAEQAASGEGE